MIVQTALLRKQQNCLGTHGGGCYVFPHGYGGCCYGYGGYFYGSRIFPWSCDCCNTKFLLHENLLPQYVKTNEMEIIFSWTPCILFMLDLSKSQLTPSIQSETWNNLKDDNRFITIVSAEGGAHAWKLSCTETKLIPLYTCLIGKLILRLDFKLGLHILLFYMGVVVFENQVSQNHGSKSTFIQAPLFYEKPKYISKLWYSSKTLEYFVPKHVLTIFCRMRDYMYQFVFWQNFYSLPV